VRHTLCISPSKLLLAIAVAALLGGSLALAQLSNPTESLRDRAHSTPDWALIASHLPDPATASAARLELEGDVLRARRFPEDALEYYGYALDRGGDFAVLMNKMGVTELEMGNTSLSRTYFQRVLKKHRKYAQTWNNLGAVDSMTRNFKGAIEDYRHAIKLDKHSAVYRSNLGLAYIDTADYDMAREQIILALKLDPDIYTRTSSAGTTLHLLTTADRARFSFEMAKVYARIGDEADMLHALETASEAGMDILPEMMTNKELAQYVKDPRVITIVRIAKSMRKRPTDVAGTLTPLPAIPPAAH
jgi:tetratricopeptide (TPR) repeat protein